MISPEGKKQLNIVILSKTIDYLDAYSKFKGISVDEICDEILSSAMLLFAMGQNHGIDIAKTAIRAVLKVNGE